MSKSRSFSIYLLKEGFGPENALREDHGLDDAMEADELPPGATLYVLDSDPYFPWWRGYFGIKKQLRQVGKGALVFLPVGDRTFALSFGHVAHNLREDSYEYDFGIKVTLNSVDPKKLKSTDTLDPGGAKRQRTQLPIASDLTFFDFDRDSTILRNLTGKVRDEHQELFKHATGGSNLRISTNASAEELVDLAKKLLELFESEDYKAAFPNIQNITPVRDPVQVEKLNSSLLTALRERDANLNITVPEIINYSDNLYVMFAGVGRSLIYDDVFIGRYFDYLDQYQVDFNAIDIDTLRHHHLVLTDEEGTPRDRYSIYKSLVFDTTLDEIENETFHLSEGHWYKIDNDFIQRLSRYLDPVFADSDLPPYQQTSEGQYNLAVAEADGRIACVDRSNISPDNQTAVEPCDILTSRDGVATLYHIKVSTLSAQLSHLFNQGVNSIELLRLEPNAVNKLEALIRERLDQEEASHLVEQVRLENWQVIFGIVTRKDPRAKSKNLPLFSRISLMRAMKSMHLMNVHAQVMFIRDDAGGEGRRKLRKKKAVAA